MKIKIVFLAAFLVLGQFSNAYCLEANLFSRYSGKSVKVFIADIQDGTSAHELDLSLVKARIEAGLKERKSIKFQVVTSPDTADITMETTIVSYAWSDHDPIDMLVGIGGTAMDAAVVEDYASLQADVTISDARSKKPLWQKRLFATITKKPMSKPESLPLVTDNFVKAFIKDCFSKRRS